MKVSLNHKVADVLLDEVLDHLIGNIIEVMEADELKELKEEIIAAISDYIKIIGT